jgi:O-antigen ligase
MIWLLAGYLFLFVYRPFEIWPVLGTIRLELLYMIVTGAVWLVTPKRLPSGMLLWLVATFALAMLVASLTSRWTDQCLTHLDSFYKFLIFGLMVATVVHDDVSLKRLLWAFTLAMGIYALHSFREFLCGRYVFRMGIPRMIGVDSTRGDPNGFAATLTYALAFVPVLWRGTRQWQKAFLAGYTLLLSLCILLTGSRSGMVGLILLAVMLSWQSRYRVRVGLTLVCTFPLAFVMLPERLQNRFETIINPEAGPANAQTSSDGRIQGLIKGLELFQQNPVTGVGPGAFRPASGSELETHNLYGQLLGEAGLVGAVPFAALLLAMWWTIRSIRRWYCEHPEWPPDLHYWLAGALGATILLLLVKGNFGHNLFAYNWTWCAFLLIASQSCLRGREELASTQAYWGEPEPEWAEMELEAEAECLV